MNPYIGASFFQTLYLLITRLLKGCFLGQMYPDEIQFLALVGLSISCGLIGSLLSVRKMSMLANSLSHTILLGIILTFLLKGGVNNPYFLTLDLKEMDLLLAAGLSAFLTAFLTHFCIHILRMQEDASIGLVFTALFAIAITMVTLFTRSIHLGIEVVMGNIDLLDPQDVKLIWKVAFIDLFCTFVFFRAFKLSAFDPLFSASQGMKNGLVNYFLMLLASLTCISAFKSVGVLLVLSFLVTPFLWAKLFAKSFQSLLFFSIGFGILFSFLGIALSRHLLSYFSLPLSTGALVATLMGFSYFLFLVLKNHKLLFSKKTKKSLKI